MHVPEITDIYNEAILERMATADTIPRSLRDRQTWFEQFNNRYPIFVGLIENQVACYGCLFKFSPKNGYDLTTENAVYVKRIFRGRGHGRQMLQHLIAEAHNLGFRHVCARIFSHNEPSLRLHLAEQFSVVGVQHEIAKLDDRWVDVTVFERLLK